MFSTPHIVIDTNVLLAALRSRRGASYRLLSLVGTGMFEVSVSVPLVIEYEEVLKQGKTPLSDQDVDDILDYLCRVAHHVRVFYLWRPFLKDPSDDMLLELAVAAGCEVIVTFDRKDFKGIEQFGIKSMTPREFLQMIGGLT